MSNEQQTQQADDPSGPGWRDVEPDELLRYGDLFRNVDHWQATQHAGQPAVDERTYRRRIEPQPQPQPEPEDKTQELPEYTPPEGWRVVRFGEQLLPKPHHPRAGVSSALPLNLRQLLACRFVSHHRLRIMSSVLV